MKAIIVASLLTISPLLLLGMSPGGKNLIKKSGNFENFSGNEPNGWSSTNIGKALTVVSPSTKCHSIKYAARCDVKYFYGSKVAGMIRQ